ncbi:MAG: hypothetical protein JNM52_10590 [Betaproteobacteria bacterium]|nr:hypothetical protein [Betaproteobacteria bacterium]
MTHARTQAIELTLRIEGENVSIIQIKKASPHVSPPTLANDNLANTPAYTPADILDKLINSFGPGPSPGPSPFPSSPPRAARTHRTNSAARRLQQQIENELAQDNQRIGIHLIGRITQGMMTDPTGVLAKTRADQIFGMLELAELLDLNDDMRQFLENHHAAILHRLR